MTTLTTGWLVGRIALIVALLLLAALYVRGWRRQRQSEAQEGLLRQLLFFWAGLFLLALVVISPLNYWATQYFSARVTYHLLLVASIPSLLMASQPVSMLLSGLERGERLERKTAVFPLLKYITQPAPVLLLFVSTVWLWYDPLFHQAALRWPLVRFIEAVTLLGMGLLYWWHIILAYPRWHEPLPPIMRIIYVFLGAVAIKLVGGILIFTMGEQYLYPATFALFNGVVLTDKVLGAIIVWTFGGVIYSTTAVLLLRDWFGIEEQKPLLPRTIWDNKESLIAPHLKQQKQ